MLAEMPTAPVCVTMPSANSARDFMAGTPGSLTRLVVSYLGRTAIVAAGMAAAGKREHLWRDAAAGTAIIEAMILSHFSNPANQKTVAMETQQNIARFLQGNPQYILPILTDIVLRAGQIGLGMFIVGAQRSNPWEVISGSAAIELFIMLYTIMYGQPCPVPAMQLTARGAGLA